MPATQRARAASRAIKADEDEALRPATPVLDEAQAAALQAGGAPALPNLDAGPLEPEGWLALQQTIGNSAVGGLVERRKAGQSLPAHTRHDMEASFGRSFGQVQVHSGPEVDQAAQALDAAAFTVGDDIFFRSELPGFDQPLGRQVLGEELAHVAQGAGKGGVVRVTDPGEPAEREARAAGREAAAGEAATVHSRPQAQHALARFDLFGPIAAAGRAIIEAVEKQELGDDEKDRLQAGAMLPLAALWPKVSDQMLAAANHKQSNKVLMSLAENSEGISSFILSFSGTPAVQPTLESAATAVARGRQSLLGAIDPTKAVKGSAGILAAISGEIGALAAGPQSAGMPPTVAVTGQPAPTAPAAQTETLSAAEADQLRTGAADPLKSASDQLSGEEPELDLIIGRLSGIPAVLRSFSKPAALVPQLHRKAIDVEGQIARLQAVIDGPLAALTETFSEWGTALSLLAGLTAKSPGGTKANSGAAPAAGDGGDDDDQKKP